MQKQGLTTLALQKFKKSFWGVISFWFIVFLAFISVFAYGIIFMLLIATKSFRELFGIPEFDLGFNTNMPTLIFTYGAMLYYLNYFVPKFTFDKK